MFYGGMSCVLGRMSCVLLNFLTKGATLCVERRVLGRNPFGPGLNAGDFVKIFN